jgi:hypothetical protein
MVERWNGKAWRVQHLPNPAGSQQAELNAVSCSSAAACVAVGSYIDLAGSVVFGLAEHWNGRSWTLQKIRDPAGSDNTKLYGVSCISSQTCIAVGFSSYGTDTYQDALAEQWNGRSWAILDTAGPSRNDDSLANVSCTSAQACTAVGARGSGGTLAERLNGSSWTIERTSNQAGRDQELNGVSCSSQLACTAVRSDHPAGAPGPDSSTLAASWTGGT